MIPFRLHRTQVPCKVRVPGKKGFVRKEEVQSEYSKKWKTSITSKRMLDGGGDDNNKSKRARSRFIIHSSHSFIEVRSWNFGEKQR